MHLALHMKCCCLLLFDHYIFPHAIPCVYTEDVFHHCHFFSVRPVMLIKPVWVNECCDGWSNYWMLNEVYLSIYLLLDLSTKSCRRTSRKMQGRKHKRGNYAIQRTPVNPHECVSWSISILKYQITFYVKARLVQVVNIR